eukprot:XP_020406357.1 vegetative cell wall protein gp1-like [Zea mays]
MRGRLQPPQPPWWDPPVIAPVIPCSSPSPPRRMSLSLLPKSPSQPGAAPAPASFVRAASSSAVSLPISLPFPAAPFFFLGPCSPRPWPGARGLTPGLGPLPTRQLAPARSPTPSAAPACSQRGCSRWPPWCGAHSPASPARGVLPARRSAWPGVARDGLAQAQLAAAWRPFVVRRLPGAAPSCARCLGSAATAGSAPAGGGFGGSISVVVVVVV